MKDEICEIYTDGIGKIHFLGGMLRLDLFSFNPSDSDDKTEPVITKRLIMSPNAFLASYESFVNMIDKLQEAGIIAKNEEEQIPDPENANIGASNDEPMAYAPESNEEIPEVVPEKRTKKSSASVKEEIVNPK